MAYAVAYLAAPLGELAADGTAPPRLAILQLILVPEILVEAWFGDPPVPYVLDRFFVAAGATAILVCTWRWGVWALRALRYETALRPGERAATAISLGLAALSTIVFCLALSGFPGGRLILAGMLVLPAVFDGLRFAVRRIDPGTAVPSMKGALRAASRYRWWIAVAVLFAAPILLGGMLPPLEFDVLEYHLQAPKEFFSAGRLHFLPHNVYGNMPLGAEMFPLAGMVLTGDVLTGAMIGKTVIAAFALLGAVWAYVVAARLGGRAAGWCAAIVLLSSPWTVRVSTLGLIDLVPGVYLLAGLWLLLRPGRSQARRDPQGEGPSAAAVFLAGAFAGTAAGCKYPAVLFCTLPVAFVLAVRLRRCPQSWLVSGLVFFGGALAAGGGWYLKNWWFTGNPVYPLLDDWFGGPAWDVAQQASWHRVHRPPDFAVASLLHDLRQLAFGSAQSPFVLPGVVLGVLAAIRRRRLRGMLGVLAFGVVAWWSATHRLERFLVPLLPLAAVVGGVGAADAFRRLRATFAVADDRRSPVGKRTERKPSASSRKGRHSRRLSRAAASAETTEPPRGSLVWRMVAAGLVFLIAVDWFSVTTSLGGDNRYFVSLETLKHDRTSAPIRVLNTLETDPGERILAVGDAALFYLDKPVMYATCFDRHPWRTIAEGRSPREIARELNARRIRYVYVNLTELDRYRSPGNYGFDPFVQAEQFTALERAGVLRRIAEGDRPRYVIYRVESP
ncbi:hypothetical protein JCM19992_02290 [Thermostilla marina]